MVINVPLALPAHWAEAHGAEVSAEHLDTRPDTFPVLSGSPKKAMGGGKEEKE